MTEESSRPAPPSKGLTTKIVIVAIIVIAVFMYIRSLADKPSGADAPPAAEPQAQQAAKARPGDEGAVTGEVRVQAAAPEDESGAGGEASAAVQDEPTADAGEAVAGPGAEEAAEQAAPEVQAAAQSAEETPPAAGQAQAPEKTTAAAESAAASGEEAGGAADAETAAAEADLRPAPPAELRAIERVFAPELAPERPPAS